MGQDYSYSLTSTSYEDTLGDEAESSLNIAEPYHYAPNHEADDGIPRTCYCGDLPVVATAYTSRDPGRRYFTCGNAEDGDCHIWKWWDVAVMEEMEDFQRQLRVLNGQQNESEQNVAKLEKTVSELAKKKGGVRDRIPLLVCALAAIIVLICMVVMVCVLKDSLEELQRLKKSVSDL